MPGPRSDAQAPPARQRSHPSSRRTPPPKQLHRRIPRGGGPVVHPVPVRIFSTAPKPVCRVHQRCRGGDEKIQSLKWLRPDPRGTAHPPRSGRASATEPSESSSQITNSSTPAISPEVSGAWERILTMIWKFLQRSPDREGDAALANNLPITSHGMPEPCKA